MTSTLNVIQLFDYPTHTYTYILTDTATKKALIIDSVLENHIRDKELLNKLEVDLIYSLETHVHADHITGASKLKESFNQQRGLHSNIHSDCVDIPLRDNQILDLGTLQVKVIATPGHTNTCMSFLCENSIFTGDCLLIDRCGRTDFQEGSSDDLFNSVRHKLFTLPDETLVYPGHDYKGFTCSTIGFEKLHNSRLNLNIELAEFKTIMSHLKLSDPKKIEIAVPANLTCGRSEA